MAQIPRKTIHHRKRTLPPNLLTYPPRTSKLHISLSSRLVLRHAPLNIFRDLLIHVQLNLLLQLRIALLPLKKSAPFHHSPSSRIGVSPITSPIARAICRQRLVSTVNCLRPAVVSR